MIACPEYILNQSTKSAFQLEKFQKPIQEINSKINLWMMRDVVNPKHLEEEPFHNVANNIILGQKSAPKSLFYGKIEFGTLWASSRKRSHAKEETLLSNCWGGGWGREGALNFVWLGCQMRDLKNNIYKDENYKLGQMFTSVFVHIWNYCHLQLLRNHMPK